MNGDKKRRWLVRSAAFGFLGIIVTIHGTCDSWPAIPLSESIGIDMTLAKAICSGLLVVVVLAVLLLLQFFFGRKLLGEQENTTDSEKNPIGVNEEVAREVISEIFQCFIGSTRDILNEIVREQVMEPEYIPDHLDGVRELFHAAKTRDGKLRRIAKASTAEWVQESVNRFADATSALKEVIGVLENRWNPETKLFNAAGRLYRIMDAMTLYFESDIKRNEN